MQNSKLKIVPKLKTQNSRLKICYLSFVICHLFVIWVLTFGISKNAYALNLKKAKEYF